MKRIKSINGYTIYEATSQRDADTYNCEVGSYNIYLSTDIRDFGLRNSYPEYENIDSLAVALAMCSASHYGVAVALADELSDSTVQDMDLTLEIERRLESGEALETIRRCYDRETGRLYESISDAIDHGFDPYANDEFDPYEDHPSVGYDEDGRPHIVEDECGWDEDDLDGDLEDVFETATAEDLNMGSEPDEVDLLCRAMTAAGYDYVPVESYIGWLVFRSDYCDTLHFITWQAVREWLEGVVFDDPEVSDAVERVLHPEHFDGTRLYDRVHALFDERDYHDRARFTARMAEIADELGLTQEQVDGFTSDWEMWFEASVPVYHSNALLEEGRFYADPSLETYREELAAGIGSEETCDEIETCGIWGRAVLEIGYADIELNITRPEGNHIIAEYFCCLKQADGEWFSKGYIDREADIDWMADNWQDLLHDHMRRTLLDLSAYDSGMDFSTPFVEEESAAWAGLYAAEQCPVEEEPVYPAEFVEDLFRNELLYNEPSPLTIEEAAFNLQCYVESGLDVPADLTAELLREEWNALCEKLHPAEPKQERRSHASYYVTEDSDGQYITRSVGYPGDLTPDQYKRYFFRKLAEFVAFDDCHDERLDEIVYDGEPCEYVGWQPGMLIEFRSIETGEIVYSGSFPEWDH